ncbi:hypothetical protein [Actinomadura sp. 9N215]|uniref:hypothetical protein n=1 Tax=Actinomadura sp. 9N215 TaxID=3375150 RepID=UPI0037B750FB
MKFELVQFPAADVTEMAAEQAEDEDVQRARPDGDPDGDPVAAIEAAAARLTADARSEGERIGASLAELAAVVHGSALRGQEARPPGQGARPLGNFRSDRFSKGDAR